jgi:hypothetical protein
MIMQNATLFAQACGSHRVQKAGGGWPLACARHPQLETGSVQLLSTSWQSASAVQGLHESWMPGDRPQLD